MARVYDEPVYVAVGARGIQQVQGTGGEINVRIGGYIERVKFSQIYNIYGEKVERE